MKVRNGFVSNSSSSSFICDVCGIVESGWDMCLSDADMMMCVNGHTFCKDEIFEPDNNTAYKITIENFEFSLNYFQEQIAITPDNEYYSQQIEFYTTELIQMKNMSQNEVDEVDWNDDLTDDLEDSDMPAVFCPICMMGHISDESILSYLLKKINVNRYELKEEIREKFKSQDDLYNYIKKD